MDTKSLLTTRIASENVPAFQKMVRDGTWVWINGQPAIIVEVAEVDGAHQVTAQRAQVIDGVYHHQGEKLLQNGRPLTIHDKRAD